MKRAVVLSLIVFAAAALPAAQRASGPASTGTPCANLTALTIPTVTVVSSADVAAGPFQPTGGGRGATVPPMCRVAAVAAPSADSHINIEVWMPAAGAWNGKLLGTDNGGFSGTIAYAAMASAVSRGYAAVGTDTGHTGDQMEFGQGHPEKIIDWSYRAIHVMTDLAKLVVRNHFGRFPDDAYFSGCSTGGQEALSEAQRFPDDYDGIVAGDPGNDRLNLIYGFLWSWMATHDADGKPILAAAKLPAITKAAVAACDVNDGVKDGLINDPRTCHFDPATIACKGSEDNACLTTAEVTAVKKVYDGVKNPRTGEQIFPGWARGSEQGWTGYITGPREPVRVGLFRNFTFNDPAWDMRTFDWDKDIVYINKTVPYLSAMSTDLKAFKARGGKLVMYTGMADPVVPPADVINYYEAVMRTMGGAAATQSFYRFFPVPGMGHCNGGAGPATFDALGAVEQWVEHGKAPASLEASHATGGKVDRTRPLCPYPAWARYKGAGSIDEAANFTCLAPAAK